ncbi:MAG: endonuclease MutS2 [Chloroflexi bacterium]|nr:endonuclease MutS2 [Chloroflexota bacterium]MDA1173839.1 endonuclease MutS2 [Chloroflexota bacterium]
MVDQQSPTAPELRQHSLELLEFPKVREALADFTQTALSRERALSLEPSYDVEVVRQHQQETAEARVLLESAGFVDLSLGADPMPLLDRASRQGRLAGPELMIIADALDLTRRAKQAAGGPDSKTPLLRNIARNITDLRSLEHDLRGKLSSSGELLDGASSYLRQLREEGRAAYKRATRALEAIIAADAGTLQEHQFTVRSERLVLPVKSDFRGRLPGIVHGVSDSGATLFIEPLSNVGLTNAWREANVAEEEESLRILRELSATVSRRVGDILHALELTARIDVAFAKARYARSYHGVTIETSAPYVHLVEARHPLLKGSPVPVSLAIAPPSIGLVVTGPNTGGKTVALKTLGLMVLMHQTGLQLPCDPSTTLPLFDGVYADIGDQQSIAAAVSTFSSHIQNISAVLKHSTRRSLVLLDELGTSTDPDEGSALARAIIAHLADREVPTMVTTHHRNVAALAEEHASLENASVELDPQTLEPTYRIAMGLPGRSYAMEVAERIGLDQSVVDAAKAFQDPLHRETEVLLASIQEERHRTRLRLQEAEDAERRAAELTRELEAQIQELELAQTQVVEDVRRELQEEARRIQAKLKQAESTAQWTTFREEPPAPRVLEESRTEVADVQRMLRSKVWGREAKPAGRKSAIAVGDMVEVGSMGFSGKVLSEPDDDQKVEVLVGSARIKMEVSRIRKAGPAGPGEVKIETSIKLAPGRSGAPANAELDLRGLRLHEALERLDDYLDAALAQGMTAARIIHGKGTGALRQGVWRHLANHGAIDEFDFAPRDRGGDGATEITLA